MMDWYNTFENEDYVVKNFLYTREVGDPVGEVKYDKNAPRGLSVRLFWLTKDLVSVIAYFLS